ncbi:MAG TPA: hypothetical protein VGE32_03800 [Cellvibrio sp.]
MKSRSIVFVLFFIFAIVGIFFLRYEQWGVQSDVPPAKTVEMEHLDQSGSKSLGDIDSISPTIKANEVNKKVQGWSPMGDAATAEKIKSWFAARGNYSFFGPDSLSDYQGYDMETLTRLSDTGDIKAMHVLADRANNFLELKSILMKAAVHGSTEALIQLGSLNENDEGNIGEKPPEVQKAKILTALSYYEVAQMRGDWWGNIAAGKSLTERYSVNLTEQDMELIKNLSEKIYQDLAVKRSGLGLGEFDNSVPDSVIKFYEEMVKPL